MIGESRYTELLSIKYGLYCEKEYLNTLLNVIHFLAAIFLQPLIGTLTENLGTRLVMVGDCLLVVVFSVCLFEDAYNILIKQRGFLVQLLYGCGTRIFYFQGAF